MSGRHFQTRACITIRVSPLDSVPHIRTHLRAVRLLLCPLQAAHLPTAAPLLPLSRFYTREAATTALDRLHLKELPDFPSTKVRIQPSQAKHKLFIGGIPHELTRDTLKELLDPVVRGGWWGDRWQAAGDRR